MDTISKALENVPFFGPALTKYINGDEDELVRAWNRVTKATNWINQTIPELRLGITEITNWWNYGTNAVQNGIEAASQTVIRHNIETQTQTENIETDVVNQKPLQQVNTYTPQTTNMSPLFDFTGNLKWMCKTRTVEDERKLQAALHNFYNQPSFDTYIAVCFLLLNKLKIIFI
uniref:Uncharacterized protein n=1 Tax=Panagrolaimus davidi TaxID=227884 RepID=A0A914Q0A1_9BILA